MLVLFLEELAFRDCQAAFWLLASWQLKEGDLRLRLQILRIVSGGLSTLGLWRSGGRRSMSYSWRRRRTSLIIISRGCFGGWSTSKAFLAGGVGMC